MVFVGYSGRDPDFQPLWNELLTPAKRVLWFEQRDHSDPSLVVDERRKRLLLRDLDERGDLCFPPPASPPACVPPDTRTNASWDFVAWCSEQGLIDVDPSLARQLFDDVPEPVYPPLPGDVA